MLAPRTDATFRRSTMLTLRALLDRHPTILLIDSASACIQVGLLQRERLPRWESATAEAGTALFSLVEKLLAPHFATTSSSPSGNAVACRSPLAALDAYVFCHGPGSVLGIRTAAVALRTWQTLYPRPCYAYTSLALVAQSLARGGENLRDFSVVADARRETWHRIQVDSFGALSPLHRAAASELQGSLLMPAHFRHWSALPPGVRTVPYDLSQTLPALADTPLFVEAPEPDAFLHEEPAYQTWSPKIHRAPV